MVTLLHMRNAERTRKAKPFLCWLSDSTEIKVQPCWTRIGGFEGSGGDLKGGTEVGC